jgi:hypothetical protein
MLRINECSEPSVSLGFSDDVQRKARLARTLRPVDLNDPAAGNTADTEREVERECPGGDHIHFPDLFVTHSHDGARAKLALDLGHGHFNVLVPVTPVVPVFSHDVSFVD